MSKRFYCFGCSEIITEEESVIHYYVTEDRAGNQIQVQCGPQREIEKDETLRFDLQWCPCCGCNAKIVTWEVKIGTRYLCMYCGTQGRFGDGTSEPSLSQPKLEE